MEQDINSRRSDSDRNTRELNSVSAKLEVALAQVQAEKERTLEERADYKKQLEVLNKENKTLRDQMEAMTKDLDGSSTEQAKTALNYYKNRKDVADYEKQVINPKP
jgi:hypothetical protein